MAAQLLELEQVLLGARGQHLRFALVVVVEHLLHFLVVHHRRDLLGQLVHVAVAALQPERGLGAVVVVLGGAQNVLLVDAEHHFAHLQHALEHSFDFAQLGGRVVVAECIGRDFLALSLVQQQVQVLQAARGHGCEHGVAGHAVFDVAKLEHLLHATQHVAEVVDVGTVGQHVGNLEDLARLGVRVARHDHAKRLPRMS